MRAMDIGRGALMGTADLVPGISGGTVALLLKVHTRLISAIAAWGLQTPRDFRDFMRGDKEKIAPYDFGFILPLGLGIFGAILAGSTFIEHALVAQPKLLMALFFGLILSASQAPWRLVRHRAPSLVWLYNGTAIAVILGLIPGAEIPAVWWGAFIGGFIAVSAMILPGISGSGLLILLGLYGPVLGAASGLNMAILLPFALGGLLGVMLTARGLRYLLSEHADQTLAMLTGLLLGSLVLVWPWRSATGFAEGLPAAPGFDVLWIWVVIGLAIPFGLEALAKFQPEAE
jgi:putative membrane protein